MLYGKAPWPGAITVDSAPGRPETDDHCNRSKFHDHKNIIILILFDQSRQETLQLNPGNAYRYEKHLRNQLISVKINFNKNLPASSLMTQVIQEIISRIW
jgi:hypothetical protein